LRGIFQVKLNERANRVIAAGIVLSKGNTPTTNQF
jgi:hypothetical protein